MMEKKFEGKEQIEGFTRRDFLRVSAAAGKGLLLMFYLPGAVRGISTLVESADLPNAAQSFAPNAFLRIDPNEIVTIWVGKTEMGQGVRTSLPMIVAEELEADWSKVRVEQAVLEGKEAVYGNLDTGGSSSVREGWEPLRRAGATARDMLSTAAAAKWNVSPETCRAEKGFIIHTPSKRRLSYGQLAQAAAKLSVPKDVRLKDKSEFKIVGKPIARIDGKDIVTGKAGYGFDVRVPKMLVATILRCPVFGGKVASFDDTKAKQVSGVRRVIEVKSRNQITGVAVIADSTWAALKGREALSVKWDEGENFVLNSENIRALFAAKSKENGTVTRNEGNVGAALAKTAKKIEAEYEIPFLAHAPVEPMNCTAYFHDGICELWSPTQFPGWVRGACANELGIAPEAVRVHPTLVGGGFGRRINPDYAIEAAQLSKAVAAPVQVIWKREDDMQHGFYRPASLHHLSATIDGQNSLTAWQHKITGTSIMASVSGGRFPKPEAQEMWGAMDLPYRVPNLQVSYVHAQTSVPLGWWRAVERTQNIFVTESFIDEAAYAAKRDPLQFRLDLLKGQGTIKFKDFFPPDKPEDVLLDAERLRKVLEFVGGKAAWNKRLPKGWGRGVACHGYSHAKTYVAQVAEVEILKSGKVRVHRVVCAIDCGTVVNPDTVAAQMEGAIVWGLSSVFGGEITIENGRVAQETYRDYPVLRMAEMPLVEVHIVPSDLPPGGVGEPGVPPVAPAVTNAIFAATGKRIRRLPINQMKL